MRINMGMYAPGKKTRWKLIQTAGELAAEMGFTNVSIRTIAKKAAENVGTIHYHFGSKEGLFKEVVLETIRPWLENPLSKAMEPYLARLATPEGQARAVRAVIHHHIMILFSVRRPLWQSQVIYQVVRLTNPFRPLVNEAVIEPNEQILKTIFQSINPEITYEDYFLYSRVLIAPIIFHANYIEACLEQLGQENYPETYLQKLEEVIVRQTLSICNLPRV